MKRQNWATRLRALTEWRRSGGRNAAMDTRPLDSAFLRETLAAWEELYGLSSHLVIVDAEEWLEETDWLLSADQWNYLESSPVRDTESNRLPTEE